METVNEVITPVVPVIPIKKRVRKSRAKVKPVVVAPVIEVVETVAIVATEPAVAKIPDLINIARRLRANRVVVDPVIPRKKQSKTARALILATANTTLSNKDLTALFQKELSMTEAGARTYVYNARKK
jgi:hypothetical protein